MLKYFNDNNVPAVPERVLNVITISPTRLIGPVGPSTVTHTSTVVFPSFPGSLTGATLCSETVIPVEYRSVEVHSVLVHCKNGSVTLTQVGLSELQLHYQTMCKQVNQKKKNCTTVSLKLQ